MTDHAERQSALNRSADRVGAISTAATTSRPLRTGHSRTLEKLRRRPFSGFRCPLYPALGDARVWTLSGRVATVYRDVFGRVAPSRPAAGVPDDSLEVVSPPTPLYDGDGLAAIMLAAAERNVTIIV